MLHLEQDTREAEKNLGRRRVIHRAPLRETDEGPEASTEWWVAAWQKGYSQGLPTALVGDGEPKFDP